MCLKWGRLMMVLSFNLCTFHARIQFIDSLQNYNSPSDNDPLGVMRQLVEDSFHQFPRRYLWLLGTLLVIKRLLPPLLCLLIRSDSLVSRITTKKETRLIGQSVVTDSLTS